MPKRIQRKRTKGWRMPQGAVYVGRPTRWGNHAAKRASITDRAQAMEEFTRWLCTESSWAWRESAHGELRGRDLVCWCPLDQPCHADVLLNLVNDTPSSNADSKGN